MSINLDDLAVEIAHRKREALKGILIEVLSTFEAENVPMSEVLDSLTAVVHEYSKGRHTAWGQCVGLLEKVAELAETAEQAGKLEGVL